MEIQKKYIKKQTEELSRLKQQAVSIQTRLENFASYLQEAEEKKAQEEKAAKAEADRVAKEEQEKEAKRVYTTAISSKDDNTAQIDIE